MKKFLVLVLAGVVVAVAGMSYFSALDSRRIDGNLATMGKLLTAERALGSLSYEVEKLRALGSRFRKMDPAEAVTAIRGGRDSFRKTLVEIRPSLEEAEQQKSTLIGDKLDELTATSERLLPNLYNKDPYQVDEVRALHEDAQREIAALATGLHDRGKSLSAVAERNVLSKARVFVIGGGAVLLLFVSVLLAGYRAYHRPLTRLFAYASELKPGVAPKPADAAVEQPLPGMYGTIHASLANLAAAAESHLKERHKFILDLVSDLAAPLRMLKAGKELLARREDVEDPELEQRAAESIRCGTAVLSGGLDDLIDLAGLGTLEERLEEKLVDVSELVMSVARTMSCPSYGGVGKQVLTSVPPMPVWIKTDSKRMERALTHAVLKVGATVTSGTVRISVSEPLRGGQAGLEILIQDGDRQRRGEKRVSTGPEIDVSRHWIGDSGLTLALARKVIHAQGGTMTASGVPGTSAQIRILLPQERLVSRGLINPPLEAPGALEAPIGLEVDYGQIGHERLPEAPAPKLPV